MDCIWVNLKNVGPLFSNLRYVTVNYNTCIKMSFTQLENHSQLLCSHDFANKRLLVCQVDVKSSQLAKLNKIAYNSVT